MPSETERTQVYFGGPDLRPGVLRDLLSERVRAVPAGGSIDWVTYYLRDRRLARDLIAAHHRGVEVRLTLEGFPRTPDANDAAIELLAEPNGLRDRLRLVGGSRDSVGRDGPGRPRVHEKLYAFSHPHPHALLGSFNPSGDDPEDRPEVLAEIGDQDRGHNFLVELADPAIVAGLVEHARFLHQAPHRFRDRFSGRANAVLGDEDLSVHFWPRSRRNPVDALLSKFGAGTRVRIAGSHIKGSSARRVLLRLAGRGATVEILAEHSERRVPSKTQSALSNAGIEIRRLGGAVDLPMHNKFTLVDAPIGRWLVFGSFNWTGRSRLLNRELGVISRGDTPLFRAFERRFDEMEAL